MKKIFIFYLMIIPIMLGISSCEEQEGNYRLAEISFEGSNISKEYVDFIMSVGPDGGEYTAFMDWNEKEAMPSITLLKTQYFNKYHNDWVPVDWGNNSWMSGRVEIIDGRQALVVTVTPNTSDEGRRVKFSMGYQGNYKGDNWMVVGDLEVSQSASATAE